MEKKYLTPTESKLLKGLGIEVTEQEWSGPSQSEGPTRTELRKKFAQMKDLSQEDLDTFNHLFEVFGSTSTSTIIPLSEEEIDSLADEVISIRSVQDMLGGREQALRSYIFDTINLNLSDPEIESGYLVSPEMGVKLSKEVSGGKPSIDTEKLKEVLTPEEFKSITNKITIMQTVEYAGGGTGMKTTIEYEINEDALQDELVKGNIGVEQLLKATKTSPRKTAFYVRKSN
jgi:hypothetical protein